MLISFTAKNIFSFKEETEFNLFPNKTQRLSHHKVNINDVDFLRFSAIYGANGSGKSNLVKSISYLEDMIERGKLFDFNKELKFKLDASYEDIPISFGIEFYSNGKLYYYTITFNNDIILNEYLGESKKDRDIVIFDRNFENEIQTIQFFSEYYTNEKNKLFVDVLAEKLVKKNEVLLTFLNEKYPEDFSDVKSAFDWFENILVIIKPDAKPGAIAHRLDSDIQTKKFGNELICSLNTGISKIEIERRKIEDIIGNDDLKAIKRISENIKSKPDTISVLTNAETGEEVSLMYEDEQIIAKRIITTHLDKDSNPVEFSVGMESDGTKRLIDYIPAFKGIVNDNKVYIIDEIERSIHPITIKEILTKISLDESARGQLIFTTHESNLLDQDIFRPDEIWFAQKDVDGSSKLYSLSDYKIHNTVDIENGYLNGRYGGIPFLSKLRDLNWHKYEVSE